MIATLNILTEAIIRDLVGGDIPDDCPYDHDYVQLHVIDATREDLKLEMDVRSRKPGDRKAPPQYIATYENVVVQIQKSTYRAYIDLPSNYMSLQYNAGIMISPMNKPNKRMIHVSNPGVTSNLLHGDLEQENFGFYTEGLRAFFMRDIKKEQIDKVLLKLYCPAPDTRLADDALPLLPENVARIKDIVKRRILNQGVNDRIADGNPNIRPQNV